MKFILYLSFLTILLIGCLSYKEGFEGGKYAYLAPNTILIADETTKNKFIAAGKKTAAVLFPNITLTDEKINQIKNELNKTNDISLHEINYYIQNNKWPYGSYIMNFLTVNKDDLLNKLKNTRMKTIDDLQKVFPTRLLYKYLIQPTEPLPPPLSNDIYMGRVDTVAVKSETVATVKPPSTLR
jgi:hypothetical protein